MFLLCAFVGELPALASTSESLNYVRSCWMDTAVSHRRPAIAYSWSLSHTPQRPSAYLPPMLQEKVIAEREDALLKEQELYNRLRNKDYGPAIALALELKRPQKLWGVLRDAMTEGMGEGEGVPGADDEGERE